MDDERIRKIGLPEDVIFDTPHMIIEGDYEFVIQNHKGILLYEMGHIIVRCKKYKIDIKGRNMKIESYSMDELVIHGSVESILFCYV